MNAVCDECIFRVATDEFRCIARASARPVEAAEGKGPLERCWGYIARDEEPAPAVPPESMRDCRCEPRGRCKRVATATGGADARDGAKPDVAGGKSKASHSVRVV